VGALTPVRNVLKAWLLLAGLCGVLALVGFGLGDIRVVSSFVFSGLLVGLACYLLLDRAVLGMLRARELPLAEAPELHAVVERLALRAGIAKPRLYVIEKGPPLALSAGRGPSSSAIAVTTALVSLPWAAEVEGVIAHEIAHIRSRDVLVQAASVVLAVLIVELSRVGGWLERALLFVLGPIASAFVHLLLSPKREFAADKLAASLCETPHALADALVRLEQAAELVEFAASPATEPLYTLNPFLEEGVAALFVTHPPVGERVRRLRALDPAWRERLRAA